jgi:acyl transferase domain-containing protein
MTGGAASLPAAPLVPAASASVTPSAAAATASASSSPIALLFPGQGSQAVGMCREAAESLPEVREMFKKAEEVLGYDLLKVRR